MKKIIIALLVLIAAYLVGAAVFAVANGQADGKVLNVEKQIIADGDMEAADTSDWNAGNSATLTKESGAAEDGDRVLKVAYNGTTNPFAYQAQVVGKTYRVTGWARGDGTAYPVYSDSGYTTWAGTTSTEWQRFDIVYEVVGGIQARLYAKTSSSGYTEWDDLVFVEHVGKTTNAEQQLLADGDMEAADTSSWAFSCSGTGGSNSKVAGAAEDGNQVIEVTRTGTSGYCYVRQAILTLGKTYRVTGWVKSDEVSVPRILMGNGLAVGSYWNGTTSTAEWQWADFVGQPSNNTSLYLGTTDLLTDGFVEFDDITVTEYTGPATDNEQQLLADGDMEAGDTSSWVSIQSDLSKESGAAEDGDLILRVSYNGTGAPQARQNSLLTGGGIIDYHLTGWARGDGDAAYPSVTAGNPLWTGTTSTEWQRIDVIKAPNVTTFVAYCNAAAAGYCDYDDLVISELRSVP